MLRNSVADFNKWRSAEAINANPRRADLGGANLSDANLQSANLTFANLTGTDLTGAKLSDADLSGADLSGADLRAATLLQAHLVGANLRGVDLTRAKLREADLARANLAYAHLTGADLRGADLMAADVTFADLTGANLTGANLRHANFEGAQLARANLTKADLTGANLRKAGLTEAKLVQADLTGADLTGAKLANANATSANLEFANLTNPYLAGANFTDVRLSGSVIVSVDLGRVSGLETVKHRFPSSIGIDTLHKSGGEIPEVFLRGAGVPEPFITNMKALIGAMEPIQFYSCFISYSSHDQGFAERLHADLLAKGLRCWFAPEDLKTGDRFQERIEESIRVFDKVMIVLSESSVQSPWVEREVNAAREREDRENGTVLFPIRIDNSVMGAPQAWAADIRRSRHIGDFCGWESHASYRKAFERLLRDLKSTTSTIKP